jgi:hypothetical protein
VTFQTTFSRCRAYRYTLWREWIGGEGYVMFIGLNPSTADEIQDDPTIRRCVGFAKGWGFSALCMTNLFAFRATDPKVMMQADDPIGKDNDAHLLGIYNGASLVVAAWGVGGGYLGRDREVYDTLGAMDCLGFTKDGHPRHPLYVRADIERMDFRMPDTN